MNIFNSFLTNSNLNTSNLEDLIQKSTSSTATSSPATSSPTTSLAATSVPATSQPAAEMASKYMYALCMQITGQIQVRKFSLDKQSWFDLPPSSWPLDQHPLVDKYIQKKESLSDKGRRTARVPLIAGKSNHPTPAGNKYLDSKGRFVINNKVLEKEAPRESDPTLSELTDVALRDTTLSSTAIFQRLGMFGRFKIWNSKFESFKLNFRI